ncbi:dihydrofolate reductase family protein [Kitasatospora sp. NPDC006697]|uniref:dihydrofolate reductase family protein n=1 Tax=Kitasatospora sp. NPDC006697 TaxID=3364020 RepID=UPI00367FF86F
MGTIVVFENVSLDLVTQDPTGDEGFSRTDWRAGLAPADRAAWDRLILQDALGAQALLLGRRSYEFFAARYPGRTGPLAERMNGLPKYVVSRTLADPGWHNSTVLHGDLPAAAARLKERTEGEIRVYASSRLVHTLIEHDLVDELRLAVFPLLMGAGTRLFDPAGSPKPLRLAGARTVGESLTHLVYRAQFPAGPVSA